MYCVARCHHWIFRFGLRKILPVTLVQMSVRKKKMWDVLSIRSTTLLTVTACRFKVHLANPLDGKEVEGQYVAIRNNAVYLEIDWARYPKLHSLYRQKYQEDLYDLTQQLKGQNSTSKTTPKKLDTLGYSVPAVEKSITDPNKKLKIWKYFGFPAVFKADVIRGDSDKGYIGCRYPL